MRGTGGPRPPPDDPEQSRRFEEAARELEVDASGKPFKRAVKTLLESRTVSAPKPGRKAGH
jgi:hypothetical protein